ncbi:PEGA domain-containing protein [Veronia pacifica]|uniref:PEGA domain-containing protein n=1 Tax=Veronia pacifica TaxID=1080227 RepID=A0A1C3EKN8_9GAMM|nr:PEGA domain-containing protein [Veronia pacifica]ODA33792.1 hypothetical protein A8L45_09185 [Veronia pacifica]
MKKIVIFLLSIFLLNGCAAMFNGTTQQVAIRSHNPKAKIYVNDMYLGQGDVVTSFKKKNAYTIRVEQEGCNAITIPVSKSFDPTTLLGTFIDLGIVSIFVVDGIGTGAWQQFDQTSYVLDAKCPA